MCHAFLREAKFLVLPFQNRFRRRRGDTLKALSLPATDRSTVPTIVASPVALIWSHLASNFSIA